MNSNNKETSRKRPARTDSGAPATTSRAKLPEASRRSANNNTTTPPTTKSTKRIDSTTSTSSSSPKPFKGLRHFSLMVCKKVEEKGTTSYNEVADELVQRVVKERQKEDPNGKFDEKNIRRRVYDALNVLMAMDIISKDKKAITWKGLPTSAHQDIEMLEQEREYRSQEIVRKRQALQDLVTQQVCFRNLAEHNHRRGDVVTGASTPAAAAAPPRQQQQQQQGDNKIPLPFIVVNTHSSAVIECNMSRDLTDVMFDFSAPFEINDDNTILKRLGMNKASDGVLQDMLPEDILGYCRQHNLLADIVPATAQPAPQQRKPPPVTPGSAP